MASLTLYAYCGMPVPLEQTNHAADIPYLRRAAARFLRRQRRRGKAIATLERGKEWEIITPDDAFMVADDEGILKLDTSVPTWKCWECGDTLPVGEDCDCTLIDDEPETIQD